MQKMYNAPLSTNIESVYLELFSAINLLINRTIADIKILTSDDIEEIDESNIQLFDSMISKCHVLIRTLNDLMGDLEESSQHADITTCFKIDQIHMLSLFKALHNSLVNEDLIVLNDLLEHELKVTLLKWKSSMMPAIKAIHIQQR